MTEHRTSSVVQRIEKRRSTTATPWQIMNESAFNEPDSHALIEHETRSTAFYSNMDDYIKYNDDDPFLKRELVVKKLGVESENYKGRYRVRALLIIAMGDTDLTAWRCLHDDRYGRDCCYSLCCLLALSFFLLWELRTYAKHAIFK